MKIINVVQDFNVGGIQKLLLEYLRFFKDNKDIDYKVVVLEKNRNSVYDELAKKEGLKIDYLYCEMSKNKHYYIRKLSNWWTYNHWLVKYLKKEKPDIVHTHNTRILIRIESSIKKLRKKYKWFHTLHSDPYAVNNVHVPVAERVFNEYGVKAICLNETQFLKAKERYGLKNCFYLFNSFDQRKIKQNIKPPMEFRKELGIPDNHLLIGCVGRVDPVKNYGFFIDVLKEIIQTNKNVTAVIAGDDSGASELKAKIKEYNIQNNVVFLGIRNDIGNVYNSIDRFVLTSLTEASPFVTLEAQLFDKTCIVSTAVPKESVCLDKKVTRLPLEIGSREWAKEILEPKNFEKKYSDLSDYSIANVTKKMISIYQAK